MADMGIHALDTVRYLMGDPQPESVYARIGTYYKNFDVDDTGVILVNWSNGVTSYIESGWWQPHADGEAAATQLYGIQGFASLFPTSLMTVSLGEPGYPGQTSPAEVKNIETGLPQRDSHYGVAMYHQQMAYFVDCIRQNRDPLPGGMEGWTNMRVVDAAYQSARSGEVVKLG
jgi:predicted dehydrogenase